MFTGREYETEIGLYNYRSRTYHAIWGRFISRDLFTKGANDARFFRASANYRILFPLLARSGIFRSIPRLTIKASQQSLLKKPRIRTSSQQNLFAYVDNSPASWTDPLGFDKQNPKRPCDPYYPKWLSDLVPQYGNYAGPSNGDPTFSTLPIDSLDELAMQHDLGWSQGHGADADIAFYQGLRNLSENPSQWARPAPNSSAAGNYRRDAELLFGIINVLRDPNSEC